ncbi:MAG: large-conductance mechanosensitive channel protein MscL [Bacteroidota bacterium]
MKTFFQEFKNFAVKGNMVDMAIGIIMGTAFNKIVSTLVKNVFMPPLGLLTGEVSLEDRKYVIRTATSELEEVAIGYGYFLEAIIDFLIIGLTVFVVVKTMNRFQSRAEDPKNVTVETPKNIELLSNIELLLEEQNRLLRKETSTG